MAVLPLLVNGQRIHVAPVAPYCTATLAFLTMALAMVGCGGGGAESPPLPAALTEAQQVADIASADAHILYFHEQLVTNGEDLQSAFGGYLLTLDMNPRDLQQDDPKHAYDTVLAKVRTVADASMRREMMRTFFNSADAP